MTKKEVIEVLNDLGIQADSFTFYCEINERGEIVESPDGEFAWCDVSGEQGTVYNCVALDNDGELVELQISDELIGGHVGKLAGAF